MGVGAEDCAGGGDCCERLLAQAWRSALRTALGLRDEFQRFLTALSVRPGMSSAIFDHWFPNLACALSRASSSSSVQGSLRMFGSSWLCLFESLYKFIIWLVRLLPICWAE